MLQESIFAGWEKNNHGNFIRGEPGQKRYQRALTKSQCTSFTALFTGALTFSRLNTRLCLIFFFFFFSQHLFNLCQRWLLLLLSESSGVKYHFRILHHCLGTTAVAVVHHVFSSYGSSFSLMIYLAEVCQGDVFQQNWLLQQD